MAPKPPGALTPSHAHTVEEVEAYALRKRGWPVLGTPSKLTGEARVCSLKSHVPGSLPRHWTGVMGAGRRRGIGPVHPWQSGSPWIREGRPWNMSMLLFQLAPRRSQSEACSGWTVSFTAIRRSEVTVSSVTSSRTRRENSSTVRVAS